MPTHTSMPAPRRFAAFMLLFSFVLFSSLSVFSQKNFIKGTARDTAAKKNLPYSIAALINMADTILYTSVRANELGVFEINKIPPGKYTLMVSYPHKADYLQQITITDTSKIDLGKIDMVTAAVLLQEVVIRSGLPIRMRGDTLEYTADSFAVRPGANVEELLKRLPGIQVDRNGKITAQGKEVKKILVDGDEFFGDDPGLASQFLQADAIDKVQVFDKKSDATIFTGIDDGTRTKTINLKLKSNKKNGSFGKLAAGSDGKKYYNHEAMGALFSGAKKISIFGMSSKTGKEGISNNELSKYVGQDYERIDDGSNSFTSNNEYESENYYGGGLPAVMSGGAHYSNKWKDGKQKLFSNYRIKQINAEGWNNSKGTTNMPDGTAFYNIGNRSETSHSFTQKASGNFTTPIDSFSTIKISVNGSLSNGKTNSLSSSSSSNEKSLLVNNGNYVSSDFYNSKIFSSNISLQHKFRKEGRTLTLLAQQDFNEGNKDNYNFSDNKYYDPASGQFKKADTLNQLQNNHQLNNSFATKLSVTEKLSDKLRLSLDYGWKTVAAENKFKTFNNENGKYSMLLDTLSNNYHFTVNTHIAGTSLGWNNKKINITLGSRIYLTGFKQVNNDAKTESRRHFVNLAPQANFNFTLKENTNLSLNYSGQSFQPSADQLQPLRKSSSSVYVQIGNPNLLPGFRHNVSLSCYQYNWAKGENLSVYASMNYAVNNIVSNTTTDAQGRTTAQYINLNGIPGLNGYLNYGWQYKKLHLRPAVTLSVYSYGNNSMLNGALVKNETIGILPTFSLNYDLPNKVTLGYAGSINYSTGKSNIGNKAPSKTFSHTHTVNATSYLSKTLILSSDCVFNFQPKNNSFSTNFNTIRWNGSLEKKLLKNDKGYIKLSVNDILNTNTGYQRSVYGNDVYESDRLAIKRYFLLTLGWNFSTSIKQATGSAKER